jgi:hypothetical protein
VNKSSCQMHEGCMQMSRKSEREKVEGGEQEKHDALLGPANPDVKREGSQPRDCSLVSSVHLPFLYHSTELLYHDRCR